MKPEKKTDPAEYTRLVWPELPELPKACYLFDSIDITGYSESAEHVCRQEDFDGERARTNGEKNE